MEERDIQIRGYRIRLPIDIFLVASANPEDYTNRGRIITPLKDRFGAQAKTHYPTNIADEISIMETERKYFNEDEFESYIPQYMKEIIAEITYLARKSTEINQSSGVSVRVSIANYETILSNAIRRTVTIGENLSVPRISDLPYIHSSTSSKIELEGFENTKESKVINDLIKKAVLNIFNHYYQLDKLQTIVTQFNEGLSVEVSDMMSSKAYIQNTRDIIDFKSALKQLNLPENPEIIASAVEFILEGLYLNRRLNKTERKGKVVYGYQL
ncbi:MAG: hypothetical protein PHQ86_03255 [Dehalococcoidales bacterium]|nr:hypothetical protein [Dehalococcoidales bacterium]